MKEFRAWLAMPFVVLVYVLCALSLLSVCLMRWVEGKK